MNFALLGDDPALLPLVQAITADPAHRLTHAWRAAGLCAALSGTPRAPRSVESWEHLLGATGVDAVIVSGSEDAVLAAGRQLATNGKPLLVFPCPGQTSTFVYELTLAQDENRVPLYPLLPHRLHPAVEQLHRLLQQGTLGAVHHLLLERRLVPSAPEAHLLAGPAIAEAFLADVDLLRMLGGDYNQVTAVRSGDGQGISLMSVTLAAAGAAPATWSAQAGTENELKLTVAGARGSLVLQGNPAESRYRLSGAGSAESGAAIPPQGALALAGDTDGAVDPGPRLLEHGAACLRGERQSPDWVDLTRAFELLDAVECSVRRRRTIDIYFETPSERSIFKTQMTAAGCSLLMLTLLAVVAYLGIAALFELSDTVKHVARFLIFLPLGLFLALQFLMVLTRPSGKGPPRTAPRDSEAAETSTS